MTTRQRVLEYLEENNGKYVSGQTMANDLYMTRASIWKAIRSLQNEGHKIEAVTNKGYKLVYDTDVISAAYISRLLKEAGKALEVYDFGEVTSTNDKAMELARSHKEDLLVVADSQTKGRGRRGREFFSPGKTGLYMSLVIHPDNDRMNIAGVTAKVAVATAQAIDEVVFDGKDVTKIKWVNDIFIEDKKVSGILTESYVSLEDEADKYLVIGVGVNVFEPHGGFPKSIKNIAGALNVASAEEAKNIRSLLAAAITEKIYFYLEGEDGQALNEYRAKSMLKDCYVVINDYRNDDEKREYAKVLGITEEYYLHICYDNGKEETLSSGEISAVKY